MIKRRILASKLGSTYGAMGTPVGFDNICIGDLISYKWNMRQHKAIVVDCTGISPMGLCSTPLNSSEISDIQVILPYNLITEEITYHLHSMFISEEEVKEMTLQEIEKELGYAVKIKG